MNIKLIKGSDCDHHIFSELKQKIPNQYPIEITVKVYQEYIELESKTLPLDPLYLSVLDLRAQHVVKTLNAQQPILKALGKDILHNKGKVIDTTAGFGNDSFIMSSYGLSVISIEQDPLVYCILDTLKNMLLKKRPDISWQVMQGNSIHWVEHITSKHAIDAIYLDPFFQKKSKSLPKNSMQWLQKLSSSSPDTQALFDHCQRTNVSRIVVKRDLKAPYLSNKLPNAGSIVQKSSRFDCYYRANL